MTSTTLTGCTDPDLRPALEGETIACWFDQSINSLQFYKSATPFQFISQAVSLNNKPSVFFSNANTYLTGTFPVFDFQQFTVIIVLHLESSMAGNFNFYQFGSTNQFIGGFDFASSRFLNDFYNGNHSSIYSQLKFPNQPYIYTSEVNLALSSVKIRINGKLSTEGISLYPVLLPNNTTLNIGNYLSGVNFNFKIPELIVFEHLLSLTELQEIEIYLSKKYAISLEH